MTRVGLLILAGYLAAGCLLFAFIALLALVGDE